MKTMTGWAVGWVLVIGAASSGCGTPSTMSGPPLCTPGLSQACACVGGGAGAQVCDAEGHFGACTCAGTDAGMPNDAAVVPGDDAASGVDAFVPLVDAGVDAFVPAVDSGIACPAPFVLCGTECIDPRESRAHCGASGACTGASAGESCGGACSAGRCVWDYCAAALAAGHTTDGTYLVDVDGSGPLPPADAYCDMTTDGGGWTLVYRIRNDIPDISDPWWGMVDLGTGSALPTTRAPLAAGTHFDGPTREVRALYAERNPGVSAPYHPELRATMIRGTDGTVLFDVTSSLGGVISWVVLGTNAGSPSAFFSGGSYPLEILGTSAGFPAVGTVGWEGFQTGNDMGFWSGSGPRIPIFGDSSVAMYVPSAANTTTLFWIRAIEM